MKKSEGKLNVSIILPTYNEKENIGLLIDEIIPLIADREYEIIVVDDNSPDLTWQVVENKIKVNKNIYLLRRMNKKGLTSALNDGIKKTKGDIIIWMDCDFQMPPSKISGLLNVIDEGYDVAVGSRFIKGGADVRYNKLLHHRKIIDIHRILSKIICRITAFLLRMNHYDWTSGLIALKREIFNKIKLHGDYGEYFMYLIYDIIKSGYKIKEIPYILSYRVRGRSKTSESYIGLIIKGLKYLLAVVKLAFFKK